MKNAFKVISIGLAPFLLYACAHTKPATYEFCADPGCGDNITVNWID